MTFSCINIPSVPPLNRDNFKLSDNKLSDNFSDKSRIIPSRAAEKKFLLITIRGEGCARMREKSGVQFNVPSIRKSSVPSLDDGFDRTPTFRRALTTVERTIRQEIFILKTKGKLPSKLNKTTYYDLLYTKCTLSPSKFGGLRLSESKSVTDRTIPKFPQIPF